MKKYFWPIVIIAIVLVTIRNCLNKNFDDIQADSTHYLRISEGNQNSLILYSEVPIDSIESIQNNYDWDNFSPFDNRLFQYMTVLFDDVVKNYDYDNYNELWIQLNKPQKVFWTFLIFNGDTNNGGVYQFFFNKPEFIYAASEIWKELGNSKLTEDYKTVLKEYNDKMDLISKYNKSRSIESFKKGDEEIKSTDAIEKYYYTENFTKELHKEVCDYIEANLDKFIKMK